MRLPRRPLAVVFDMDGLLFDTEALYQRAIISAAAEAGQEMTPTLFRPMLGRQGPVNRAYLLELFGQQFPVDAFNAEWMRHFDALLETGIPLKAGAIELLDRLDELRLPHAIATSSPHDDVGRYLTAHDMGGRFHAIVARGDYSNSKPEPDAFLTAAERLGVDPRACLALEDSHNGIRSASSAGMMAIMIPDLLEPTIEISELCTFVLPDLHAVRLLLS